MTPSQAAKTYGLKTLSQVAKIHNVHTDTLNRWYTDKPELFRAACERAAVVMGVAPDYRGLIMKCLAAAQWNEDDFKLLKIVIDATND